MKVSFEKMNEVLKSLPIGYYAKDRIPVILSKDAECSCIDIIDRSIVVSYPQVSMAIDEVDDIDYLPTAVRSSLYHEVGHAIMTPKSMTANYIYNVFEDERLETLLQPYFLNVNFKEDIKRINKYVPNTAPMTPQQMFYNVVRYREGDAELLKMVEDIIISHGYLRSANSGYSVSTYTNEIQNLWNKVLEKFIDTLDESKTYGESEDNSDSKSSMMTSNSMSDSDEYRYDFDDTFEDEDDEDAECTGENIKDEDFGSILKKLFREADGFRNEKLEQELQIIIESFNKKTNGGNALQAHSGVLNPRLVGRPDYRIFERKASERGSNKFGAVHINLFLDESGSYCSNQFKTNQLISALAQVEKICKDFTFDIVYCGEGERHVKRTERQMHCNGGNYLDAEIFDIYRKLQKQNAYNYNIILFDGDAFTDCPYGVSREMAKKNFGAFNHSNCTIISDYSNRWAITENAPAARKIFTNEYANKLIDNVISALRFAFR